KRQTPQALSVALPLISEWRLPSGVTENCAVPLPWMTMPPGSCEQVAELRTKLIEVSTGAASAVVAAKMTIGIAELTATRMRRIMSATPSCCCADAWRKPDHCVTSEALAARKKTKAATAAQAV